MSCKSSYVKAAVVLGFTALALPACTMDDLATMADALNGAGSGYGGGYGNGYSSYPNYAQAAPTNTVYYPVMVPQAQRMAPVYASPGDGESRRFANNPGWQDHGHRGRRNWDDR